MSVFIYPGTFDPVTNGHVDIARRAARLCDHLIVVILTNSSKKPWFSRTERMAMVRSVLSGTANISVESYDGLLVDFYRQKGARAVVRGLRSESDFRYEAEMAAANRLLKSDYETCLLPCSIDMAFTSSSIVREVASYGGDISGMVPGTLCPLIVERMTAAREKARSQNTDLFTSETGG